MMLHEKLQVHRSFINILIFFRDESNSISSIVTLIKGK